jgi:hypothetical protein
MSATIARQLARARADLVSLMQRDAMPSDPVKLAEALGMTPDPWQADVLRSTSNRLLLNCCRQSGKSTTTAILALHRALYVPDSMILMASPGLRQSGLLFRKLVAFYRRLGRPVPAEAETRLQLELSNGSQVVSLPGSESTVRGYSSVDLLLVDEASRVDDDGMMAALRPMLAVSNGRLIAMSTPWGRRGWWYGAWSDGGAAWERIRVDATECPRISPEFLADERRALGDLAYRSEYLCEFCDTESMAFRTDDIRGAFDPAVLPLFPIASTEGGSYVGVA